MQGRIMIKSLMQVAIVLLLAGAATAAATGLPLQIDDLASLHALVAAQQASIGRLEASLAAAVAEIGHHDARLTAVEESLSTHAGVGARAPTQDVTVVSAPPASTTPGASDPRRKLLTADGSVTRIGSTSVATGHLNVSSYAAVAGALGVGMGLEVGGNAVVRSGLVVGGSAAVVGAVAAGSAAISGTVTAGSVSISGAVAAGSAAVSGAVTAASATFASASEAVAPLTLVKPGDGSLLQAKTTSGHGLEVQSSDGQSKVRLASLQAGKTLDVWANEVTLSTNGAARARLHPSGRFDLSTHVKVFPLGIVGLEIPSADMAAVDHITISHTGYYMGYVLDVFLTGGKDWGGHGSVTYTSRIIVSQFSTTVATCHVVFEQSHSGTGGGLNVVNLASCSLKEGGTVDQLGLQFKMPTFVAGTGCSAANNCGWRPSATVVVYDGEYNLVSNVVVS